MTREIRRIIVLSLSLGWGVAFVGAFLAFAVAPSATAAGSSGAGAFVACQLMAAVLAVLAGIVAAQTHNMKVRRLAQVPLTVTGVMALVALSLFVMTAVLA